MSKGIGRLAMRVEGDLWVAYYAMTDTMDDALFLGSIQMQFVQDKARKNTFMMLMQDAVADLIEVAAGERPYWHPPHRAPESERSGRG